MSSARTGTAPLGARFHLPSSGRLARRAARGDQGAFEEIFRRYHRELYRYCLAIVHTPEDAQDAVQATMAAALRSLPGENREIALRPWLYRVAHNESISLLRRRGRVVDSARGEEATSLPPEAELADRDRLRRLVADIGELPDRQRSAIVMRELSDLPYDEIGRALSCTEPTARQTVYEARRALYEFEEGREMECESVREEISAGDRRRLRGRRITAHLRSCDGCLAFEASIAQRRSDLQMLFPPLPALAAAGLLSGLIGGSSGGAAAGAGVAATAGTGAAGVVGSLAAKGASLAAAVVVAAGAADVSGVIDLQGALRGGNPAETAGSGGSDPGPTTGSSPTGQDEEDASIGSNPGTSPTDSGSEPSDGTGDGDGDGDKAGNAGGSGAGGRGNSAPASGGAAPSSGKSEPAPGHTGSENGSSASAPGHSSSGPGNSANAPGHSGYGNGNSTSKPDDKGSKKPKDPKEPKDAKEPKEPKDAKQPKEPKDTKDTSTTGTPDTTPAPGPTKPPPAGSSGAPAGGKPAGAGAAVGPADPEKGPKAK